MSCSICGPELDIHAGGFDLKFPHHDNEIAQVHFTTFNKNSTVFSRFYANLFDIFYFILYIFYF